VLPSRQILATPPNEFLAMISNSSQLTLDHITVSEVMLISDEFVARSCCWSDDQHDVSMTSVMLGEMTSPGSAAERRCQCWQSLMSWDVTYTAVLTRVRRHQSTDETPLLSALTLHVHNRADPKLTFSILGEFVFVHSK